MKYLILICVALLAFTANAQEQSLPKSSTTVKYYDPTVPSELHSRLGEFFKLVLKDEVDLVYKNLLDRSPLARKKDELDKLMAQTERATEVYGRIQGFESVDAEVASTSLIKLRYIGLYSRYPLRWIFTFYKSPEFGWIITNVKFDDQSDYFFRGD